MPAFVCDASVAIAGVADDERHPDCETLLERAIMDGATAPAIWPLEVANILTLKFRRKLISGEGRKRALYSIAGLAVSIDIVAAGTSAFGTTIALADAHRLTTYDAAYLELAMRLGLPLATLDRSLAAAARAERVAVLAG
jgi:predicted nucleic acid-binding protein